jgi:hypothetical protein
MRYLIEHCSCIDDITSMAYTTKEAFNTFLSLTKDTSLWVKKIHAPMCILKMNLNFVAVFYVNTSRTVDRNKVITSSNNSGYISTYLLYGRKEDRILRREWKYFINNWDSYSDVALQYFLDRYSTGVVVDILCTLIHNKRVSTLRRLSKYVEDREYTYQHQVVMKLAIKNRCASSLARLMKYYPKLDPSYQSSRFRTSYVCMIRKEGNRDLMKMLLSDQRVRDKIEQLRPHDLMDTLENTSIEEGLRLIDKYAL